jgi:hypothetical protein
MTTTLTPEMRKALREAGEQPLEIIDSKTHERYMLLKADVFDRMHLLLQGRPVVDRRTKNIARSGRSKGRMGRSRDGPLRRSCSATVKFPCGNGSSS